MKIDKPTTWDDFINSVEEAFKNKTIKKENLEVTLHRTSHLKIAILKIEEKDEKTDNQSTYSKFQ